MTPADLLNYQPEAGCLAEKVVLITGPTSGIGLEVALQAAQCGAAVVLVGRDAKKLELVYEQIVALGAPEPAMAIMDFETANSADMSVLAEQVRSTFGRLDALVNNAGILGSLTELEHYGAHEYEQVMRVNAQSCFMLTQSFMELLKAAPSASVVFTSSTVGHEARACWGAYALSKAVVEHMTLMWHQETKETLVRFNCVNPGATQTSMRKQAFPEEQASTLTHPSQLAPAYVGLISDASAQIRGQLIDLQPKA